MELIITKGFLDNFFLSLNEGTKYHKDFQAFLAGIKGVTIITDLQNNAEWEKASKDNPLWENLLDAGDTTIQFIPTVETDIFATWFYSTYTYPYKLFFISKDKNTCENLCKDYGYEYFSVENLEDKWKTYYSQRDDYNLPIDSISNPRFDNWAKLSDFKHPINSIVIIDNYLFCEFKQDKQGRYLDNNGNAAKQFSHTDNILQIFKNLLANNASKIDLQILIITDSRNIDVDDTLQPSSRGGRMNYIRKKLSDFIHTEFPLLGFDITVVNYDKRIHTTESEHDRAIYTNYFYIKIIQGVNIFNCSGSIINRTEINFHNCLYNSNKNLARSGLVSIQTYLNDINNYLSANPTFDSNKLICGSGKNRLLDYI